jgi:hypothetical protein
MSHQIKRIDVVRSGNPVFVGVAIVGLALAFVGFKTQRLYVMALGGLLYAAAVLLMAKPVISTLLAILGVGGGMLTFFLLPNPEMAGTPFTTRLLATVLFSVLYLALMDTLILIASFLYNMLVENVGMGGIRMELSEDEAAAEEAGS